MGKQLQFDKLVYVGDSLTDSGAFFGATSAVAFFGLPPTAAGYAGQFSDGDVYADFVPDLLGVAGGEAYNYAVGGAQVLTDRTVKDALAGTGLIRPDATAEDLAFRVDFAGQVDRFLADTSGSDLSRTAVSVLIGSNDLDDFVPGNPASVVDDALAYGGLIASTALQATALMAGAGVGTIILNTLPSIDVFPTWQSLTPQEQALAPLVVGGYNATLRGGAIQLEQIGADVVIVELGAMWEEIAADYQSFGFRVFDQSIVLGSNGSDGVNPAILGIPQDQIGYFDSVHPTTELHEIFAAFQSESLTSEVTIGTAEGERLKGSNKDDLILARSGDDKLFLRKGDDVAIAGLGDDKAFGGKGDDLLAGGGGDDRLFGQRGNDILADGLGDDWSFGGSGADVLIDGAGNDFAFGGGGNDLFIFTEASLFGRDGDDYNYISGGGGYDTLVLRVEDASSDLGECKFFGATKYAELGLVTSGIESVVVIDGTGMLVIAGYEDALATAELWNFV